MTKLILMLCLTIPLSACMTMQQRCAGSGLLPGETLSQCIERQKLVGLAIENAAIYTATMPR